MIQLKRHHKKEDYSVIRNQLSQEQSAAMFKLVCFMLLLASLFFGYVAMHYLV